MAEKRKRGQNFTSDEKDRLVKLLVEHKNTILNKKTDKASNEAKSMAWLTVTNLFNTTGRICRSKYSLIKTWKRLKRECKFYYTAKQRESVQTGGGPSTTNIDPILEHVCLILGRDCSEIAGAPDSDSSEEQSLILEENNLPKVICINNEDINNKLQVVPNVNIEIDDLSSIYHSFQEVNKKKEGIEELKRQVLEDEINFKRKLYELQLQAATKEVEIKTEILQQLRSGSLSLQNVIGMQQTKSEEE